ncbi:MAG: ribonuclease HII [Elusimicrobia bacterium]|nr:ribonuclease HII [Elusimicrobiota bacterium]
MDLFDQALRAHHGAKCLVGVDEAGRGPLAGPVVVAAVILDPESCGALGGVRDSKTLPAEKRAALFPLIRASAKRIAVAWATPRQIDDSNILRATLSAMARAVVRLRLTGEDSALVAVDGNFPIPGLTLPQYPLIKGDGYSLAIASAGIVAKVVRDRWMESIDRRFPGYGFAEHKGYGTSMHVRALSQLGPCRVHRRSFEPVSQTALPFSRD